MLLDSRDCKDEDLTSQMQNSDLVMATLGIDNDSAVCVADVRGCLEATFEFAEAGKAAIEDNLKTFHDMNDEFEQKVMSFLKTVSTLSKSDFRLQSFEEDIRLLKDACTGVIDSATNPVTRSSYDPLRKSCDRCFLTGSSGKKWVQSEGEEWCKECAQMRVPYIFSQVSAVHTARSEFNATWLDMGDHILRRSGHATNLLKNMAAKLEVRRNMNAETLTTLGTVLVRVKTAVADIGKHNLEIVVVDDGEDKTGATT